MSQVWVGYRNLVCRLISCRVHESRHQVKVFFSPIFIFSFWQHFLFQRRILFCEDTQCGLRGVRPYCSPKVTSAFTLSSLFIKLSILNLQCDSNGSVLLEPDDVCAQPVHGSHPPLCMYTGHNMDYMDCMNKKDH